ncbi:hypothetical protein [Aeromicrobium sp. NPDC092404]|uniref:hypothetical protein n=1 Tax=Aeromicrobium sp. NPDC092404 TaxID=3154976 RepID=UPI00342D7EE6
MTNYRLDRRFVLLAVGINVVAAGVAAALAFFLSSVAALAWVFGVLAVVLLLNALRVFALPPLVARTDPGGVRLGGPLTVKPIRVAWLDIEDVSTADGRLYVDRGGEAVIAFPLAYVGSRAPALMRDVYERLNAANGYQRFDPTT